MAKGDFKVVRAQMPAAMRCGRSFAIECAQRNFYVAPHLRFHRPAHVRKAYFVDCSCFFNVFDCVFQCPY